ncbi:MAG: hemolysin family protein [Acutalibacteraceae bacterium]|nr:hemolysin family protein [Acutalibacteraceae bacterium]
MTVQIIIMLVCVVLSAYFSATETAFSSLNKTRLNTIAEKGNKKAQLALNLSDNYDKLISTILIGNNIVNILLASLGTVVFVNLYGDIGATISTAVVTVIVLIFGEISPKSIAKDCPERFAMFSSPMIKTLIFLLTPLNFLFSLWKKLISKVFKVQNDTKMSQEELLMLVDEVEQDGSIDSDESDLLRNAIEFSDRKAEDILTHRVDIEAVSVDADKEEIAKAFSQTKFSRLPVYKDNIDNIIGVIHQKDFYVGGGITQKPLEEMITSVLFVQESERLDDLLKMLQKHKTHVAVVLDEYGGTCGLVTMEDILEELVGEIWDEHDEIVEDYKQISDNHYIVDCTVNMEDFSEFFDVNIETESISLSGWVMEQLGKIPEKDDSFTFENLAVKVIQIDSHRVVKVDVIKKISAL